MNRRELLSAIPACFVIGFASKAVAAPSGSAGTKSPKMAYPYNKFTLHRIQRDEFGLLFAGPEDESIHVLTSITGKDKTGYESFSNEYSYVAVVDGQPTELLRDRNVILIPRKNS